MALVIAALASSLVFLPGLTDSFSLPKLTYLSIIALLPLVSLWDRFVSKRQIAIPFPFLTVAFLLALLLPTLIQPITHEAIVQLSLDFVGLTYFLYTVNKLQRHQIRAIAVAYVLIAMAVAIFSLAGYRWPQLRTIMGVASGNVLFGNAKYPALFVFTAVPLAFYLTGGTDRQWQKNLFIAATFLLIVFIIFSDTKVVLYGAPLLCALSVSTAVRWIGISCWFRILVVAALLFVAGLALWGVERLFTAKIATVALETIGGRIDIWNRSLPLLSVVGLGRGNYQLYSPSVGTPEMWLNTHAHNDYLEMAIESPLALLSLLAIIVSALALRTSQLGNYLKMSLCAFLITMFFWFPLALPSLAVSFWIVLGLIYVDGKTRG